MVYFDLAYVATFIENRNRSLRPRGIEQHLDYYLMARALGCGLDVHAYNFYDAAPPPHAFADALRVMPTLRQRLELHTQLQRHPRFYPRIQLTMEAPFHEQKGVDGAIIADMMEDAAHFTHMVLVTGDRDFLPVLNKLRGKVHITVAGFFQHTGHKGLRGAAADILDLDAIPLLRTTSRPRRRT
jgi:uncharacterized LabA/DUF88 family protein